jgi:uncharacterized protein (TIGR02246 family)
MRSFLLAAALVFGITATFAQSRPADEKAIHAVSAAFETAINQRNFSAVAALYTPDADLIVHDAPIMAGRAAIQAATQRDWGSTPSTRRIALTVMGIRFISAEVAIVDSRARFNEGPVKEDRGTWIAVRQPNGAWLVAALRVMPAARS